MVLDVVLSSGSDAVVRYALGDVPEVLAHVVGLSVG